MNTASTRKSFTSGLVAGLGLAAALGTVQARATVLALDDFNYGAGELQGQNGGSGFSTAWNTQNSVVNDGLPYTEVKLPGLSYNDVINSVSLPDVGNAAEFKSNNPIIPPVILNLQDRGRRDLSTPANQGTLFMSFLLRETAGSITSSDNFFLWLGGNGQAANTVARVGIFGQNGTSDDFGMQISDGSTFSTARTGGAITAGGSANLLVIRLSKLGATGSTDAYDKIELWVNPQLTAATFTTAPVSLTIAGGLSSAPKLGFGSALIDNGDLIEFDRIRLGTELSDVVSLAGVLPPQPIPEAGTFAAAGAAMLLGGGFYLRRRNQAKA